jgi:hypothetical protein
LTYSLMSLPSNKPVRPVRHIIYCYCKTYQASISGPRPNCLLSKRKLTTEMKDAVHRHKVYSDSGSNIRSGVHSTTGRVGGVGAVGTKAVCCATVLLIASGVCASPSGDITWATLGRREDTGEDLVSYASEEAMLEYYGINIGDAVASSPTIKKRGSTAMVHNRADVIENISGWTSYTWDWVTKTCVAIILSTATLALGSRFILWTAQNYQGIRAIIGSGSQSNQLTAAPMDVKRRSQGGVVTAVIKMDSIEDFTNADKQVTHTRAYQLNFDNDHRTPR